MKEVASEDDLHKIIHLKHLHSHHICRDVLKIMNVDKILLCFVSLENAHKFTNAYRDISCSKMLCCKNVVREEEVQDKMKIHHEL